VNIPNTTFEVTGIDPDNESLWKTFSYDPSLWIGYGWGNNTSMRFDFRKFPTTMLIRNSKIIVYKAP
jgi:hypothetical protein